MYYYSKDLFKVKNQTTRAMCIVQKLFCSSVSIFYFEQYLPTRIINFDFIVYYTLHMLWSLYCGDITKNVKFKDLMRHFSYLKPSVIFSVNNFISL